MPVQHVRVSPWSPNRDLGQADGTNAGSHASSLGFPPGVNVWCDLEGVAAGTAAQDVIDHCTAWFTAVSNAGYVPGLYVGANAILDGNQLFDLPFEHYWKSESRVPVLPARGYQMIQTPVADPVAGIGIDQDVTQTDGKGGQAQWLVVTGPGSGT